MKALIPTFTAVVGLLIGLVTMYGFLKREIEEESNIKNGIHLNASQVEQNRLRLVDFRNEMLRDLREIKATAASQDARLDKLSEKMASTHAGD